MSAYGITLESPMAVEDGIAKYNLWLILGGFGGLVVGLAFGAAYSGLFGLLVFALLGVGVGWIIKYQIAKFKTLNLRNMKFALPDGITVEEIYDKTRGYLAEHKITVVYVDGMLEFSSGGISYGYQENRDGTFYLRWGFGLGKALLDQRYNKNHDIIAEQMGYIVYAIQNHDV